MKISYTQSMIAPGVGARILRVDNAEIPPYFLIENKDASLGVAIHYEESYDGTTWAQIVGTSVSINPGQSNGQLVSSSARYIALFAQGTDVRIDVGVDRQLNGLITEIR